MGEKMFLHELKTGHDLEYQMTVGSRDLQVYAVRPRLYRLASPAGSVTMECRDDHGHLIATSSESLTIASIGSGTNWVGWVRFLMDVGLKAATTYRFRLKSTGYTFSESAWLAWVNGSQLRPIGAGYDADMGHSAALAMEVYVKQQFFRGVR